MHGLEAIAAVVRVAESQRVLAILIGATARAVVFDRLADGREYRATRDVDIGVRASSLEAYDGFVDALVSTEGFLREGPHKLRYHDGTEMDIVPFGGIADDQGNVAWLGGERIMQVDGFDAAAAHSETHDIEGVRVDVVSLGGLIILKLYALRDRIEVSGATDLHDLAYIVHNATQFLDDRVYAELDVDLINALDYVELGPHLLGRDVARMVPSEESLRLASIIDRYVLTPPDYIHLDRAKRSGDLAAAVKGFEAFRRGLVLPNEQP